MIKIQQNEPDIKPLEKTAETQKPDKKERFKRFGKYSFWVWIGYQAVKGTLTTTFIWGPLIYLHFFS